MAKINVKDTEITVVQVNNEDYLCLTDMLKAKDGDFFITDWLRNRNTLEYIGIWEKVYNPDFNYGEFAIIKIGVLENIKDKKLLRQEVHIMSDSLLIEYEVAI